MLSGDSKFGNAVSVRKADAAPKVLIVCEHASNRIPPHLHSLGLQEDLTSSHIAWDPGAWQVAEFLADVLEADLVTGQLSRLIYDCNRAPEAHDAVPEKSETHDIPGNQDLSDADLLDRVALVYKPFRDALASAISDRRPSLELLVTIHSFTPVFHDKQRDVEVGVLHGRDKAFALSMMANARVAAGLDVRLNEPYGPQSGVSHTLDVHGAENDLPSVMIEIRNDLIANATSQRGMAHLLAEWISLTLDQFSAGDAA